MTADECQPDKPNVKEILGFPLTILKVLFQGVLEVPRTIGDYRADLAYSVFSPHLEAFIEFLAIDCDIVINGEEDV